MSSKVNLRPLRRFLKEETTTVALSLMPDTREVLDGYLQLNYGMNDYERDTEKNILTR